MYVRTSAEMTDEVRDRSDLGDSQFRTDTQIRRYLNSSNRELTGHLIRLYSADYFDKEGTINTVSGTSSYDLPSDCFAVKTFRVTLSDGSRIAIPKATTDEIDIDTENSGWETFGVIPKHRIVQDQVRFIPTPRAVHDITVRYIHEAVFFDGADDSRIKEMADDDDYIQCYWNYEEWVILKAAIKVKHDQEEDSSALRWELDNIWKGIIAIANDRVTTEPDRIRDGYSNYDPRDRYERL